MCSATATISWFKDEHRLAEDDYQADLDQPGVEALTLLEDEPGLSSADLARRSYVSAQTMGGVVANLERTGLIKRRAHHTHGRIRQATPTPTGSRLLAKAHQRVRKIEQQMTSDLDADERHQLFGMLRRCAKALDEARKPDAPSDPRPHDA